MWAGTYFNLHFEFCWCIFTSSRETFWNFDSLCWDSTKLQQKFSSCDSKSFQASTMYSQPDKKSVFSPVQEAGSGEKGEAGKVQKLHSMLEVRGFHVPVMLLASIQSYIQNANMMSHSSLCPFTLLYSLIHDESFFWPPCLLIPRMLRDSHQHTHRNCTCIYVTMTSSEYS